MTICSFHIVRSHVNLGATLFLPLSFRHCKRNSRFRDERSWKPRRKSAFSSEILPPLKDEEEEVACLRSIVRDRRHNRRLYSLFLSLSRWKRNLSLFPFPPATLFIPNSGQSRKENVRDTAFYNIRSPRWFLPFCKKIFRCRFEHCEF